MPIITISREAGSFGDELAERLSERCGHPLMDFDQMVDKFLKPIATEHEKQMLEVSAKYFSNRSLLTNMLISKLT